VSCGALVTLEPAAVQEARSEHDRHRLVEEGLVAAVRV